MRKTALNPILTNFTIGDIYIIAIRRTVVEFIILLNCVFSVMNGFLGEINKTITVKSILIIYKYFLFTSIFFVYDGVLPPVSSHWVVA
jgi:hypothetical protein